MGIESYLFNSCVDRTNVEIKEILYQPSERINAGFSSLPPDPKQVDEYLRKVDIYSFGLIFYELIGKKYPFDYENDEKRATELVKNGKIQDLCTAWQKTQQETGITLNKALADIIMRCLAPQERRYGDFDEILSDLEKVPLHDSETSIAIGGGGRENNSHTFGRFLKAAIVVFILGGLGVVGNKYFTPSENRFSAVDKHIVLGEIVDSTDVDSELGGMIEYMLAKRLSQQNYPITKAAKYGNFYTDTIAPLIYIDGIVRKKRGGYIANIEILFDGTDKKQLKFDVNDGFGNKSGAFYLIDRVLEIIENLKQEGGYGNFFPPGSVRNILCW